MVRLYIQQDNRRWFEDVPYSQRLAKQVEIEMTGAQIYHASKLTPDTRGDVMTPSGFLGLPGQRIQKRLKVRMY